MHTHTHFVLAGTLSTEVYCIVVLQSIGILSSSTPRLHWTRKHTPTGLMGCDMFSYSKHYYALTTLFLTVHNEYVYVQGSCVKISWISALQSWTCVSTTRNVFWPLRASCKSLNSPLSVLDSASNNKSTYLIIWNILAKTDSQVIINPFEKKKNMRLKYTGPLLRTNLPLGLAKHKFTASNLLKKSF